MTNKILKRKCKHCGKEITSMYQRQLDYNVQAHELSCKKKIIEEVNEDVKNETK